MDRRCLIWALVVCLAPIAQAQIAISPRAGLIHHAEGRVSVDGDAVTAEARQFLHLDEGQVLRTGQGRAEVVLGPGTILRADHQTKVRILSDDITDVVVELLDGSAAIRCRQIPDGTQITVLHENSAARISTLGSYRFDALSEGDLRARVYRGRMTVTNDGDEQRLKARQVLNTSVEPAKPRKFDPSQKDAFSEWSRERVAAIAELNDITPYSNSQIVDGLVFLGRHGQATGRRPVHRGRPYPGGSNRRNRK